MTGAGGGIVRLSRCSKSERMNRAAGVTCRFGDNPTPESFDYPKYNGKRNLKELINRTYIYFQSHVSIGTLSTRFVKFIGGIILQLD